MFIRGGSVVTSATDLSNASACEFAFLRALDVKLGRSDALDLQPDAMLARAATLGDEHEERVLEGYRRRFGAHVPGSPGGVAEIARPNVLDEAEVAAMRELGLAAMRDGADVVFQATFADKRFVGFADFILRAPVAAPSGAWRYEVADTKLARSAKVTALLQVAAYSQQLLDAGIPLGEHVHLLLGDGATATHRLADVLPVYLRRRARLEGIVDARLAEAGALRWGDPRFTACFRCEVCAAELQAHRDVLLVGGARVSQRGRLLEAGVATIDALAASSAPVPGIASGTLHKLREQARLQLAAEQDGALHHVVHDPAALAAIPAPDAGDVFFDFEGDPLYAEGERDDWGLDYLFGLVEAPVGDAAPVFRAFWAHDHAEERQALIDFLDYLADRRAAHPGMHVYHYAAYERSHLASLAARHGVGEAFVDTLLREEVLVDLYTVVGRSLRVSSPSSSLKKLEPLYMGDDLRTSEVTTGAGSVDAYAHWRSLRDAGRADEAAALLAEIADYNAYDCRSTLQLRDWLLDRAAEAGVAPWSAPLTAEEPLPSAAQLAREERGRLAAQLTAGLEHVAPADRTPEQTALAFAGAAVDYYDREQKQYWWDHFARLEQPVEEWADTRDVLVIERAEVVRDWHREGRQRSDRRILRVSGQLAPGSRIAPGGTPFMLYDAPGPFLGRPLPPTTRPARAVTVESFDDGVVELIETLAAGAERYDDLPAALTPATPPKTDALVAAISEWAATLLDADPLPADAVTDLLVRRAPRRRSGAALAAVQGGETAEAILDSLLDLDDSYLAVQGPPGTGKTYVGSRVIAGLVRDHGWSIGVVAQSHAAVENVLAGVARAGVPREAIGKRARTQDPEDAAWTALPDKGVPDFLGRAGGAVYGGTAWDFANTNRVGRGQLDLLVVDEAGQFSLAATIAAGVSARNLLLLGDPQQLPQVSQGSHPEPVDESALAWLQQGHHVIPAERGYFLAESWRMHPAVAAPVSELSYDGALRSREPEASQRLLEGVAPGLHAHAVEHRGNDIASPEEAERVVAIARDALGRSWRSSIDAAPRPIEQRDLIVVAPYNAQVHLLRERLAAAGLDEVPVGTVDLFQGREAPVAILSMTASSAAEVPRGIGFLLMANRLNVAISRAQWAAHLVHSPDLADYLPAKPAGLAELSAFLRLLEAGRPD
ncbi:MAG: TM0106 family RecB-like putative nuclease [Microbacteriaceae bacterium]